MFHSHVPSFYINIFFLPCNLSLSSQKNNVLFFNHVFHFFMLIVEVIMSYSVFWYLILLNMHIVKFIVILSLLRFTLPKIHKWYDHALLINLTHPSLFFFLFYCSITKKPLQNSEIIFASLFADHLWHDFHSKSACSSTFALKMSILKWIVHKYR